MIAILIPLCGLLFLVSMAIVSNSLVRKGKFYHKPILWINIVYSVLSSAFVLLIYALDDKAIDEREVLFDEGGWVVIAIYITLSIALLYFYNRNQKKYS